MCKHELGDTMMLLVIGVTNLYCEFDSRIPALEANVDPITKTEVNFEPTIHSSISRSNMLSFPYIFAVAFLSQIICYLTKINK